MEGPPAAMENVRAVRTARSAPKTAANVQAGAIAAPPLRRPGAPTPISRHVSVPSTHIAARLCGTTSASARWKGKGAAVARPAFQTAPDWLAAMTGAAAHVVIAPRMRVARTENVWVALASPTAPANNVAPTDVVALVEAVPRGRTARTRNA